MGIDAFPRRGLMVMETAKRFARTSCTRTPSEIGTYASMEKRFKMLRMIVRFHHLEATPCTGRAMNK